MRLCYSGQMLLILQRWQLSLGLERGAFYRPRSIMQSRRKLDWSSDLCGNLRVVLFFSVDTNNDNIEWNIVTYIFFFKLKASRVLCKCFVYMSSTNYHVVIHTYLRLNIAWIFSFLEHADSLVHILFCRQVFSFKQHFPYTSVSWPLLQAD